MEPEASVHFNDFDLEAAIREKLEKPEGAITREDLASLNVFMAEKHEICDLSGLEHASNLDWLLLSRNQITNLAPLANLTNLSRLFLYNNQISDVTPLAGLGFLTKLYLFDNPIPEEQKAMLEAALPSCKIYFSPEGD